MWQPNVVGVGLVVCVAVGVCGAGVDGPLRPKAGDKVYVSARLESLRKSLGPTVSAQGSYEGVGVSVRHPVNPYVVEACSALTVQKVEPDKGLLRTRDARGMRHTFVGEWSSRLHSTETECRAYFEFHLQPRVRENVKLQYEIEGQ